MRGPAGPAAGAVAPGGKSETAAQLGPGPRPTRPPEPGTCCAPAPRRAPPADRALPSLGCAPLARTPSIQVQPCARRRKFCCGFSPPRLSPAPHPTRPARICWTPASPGHRRRVPAGGGRGGPASPRVGLGRAPLPGEAVPPHGPLTRSPPWRGRRTPARDPPPPRSRRRGRRGV